MRRFVAAGLAALIFGIVPASAGLRAEQPLAAGQHPQAALDAEGYQFQLFLPPGVAEAGRKGAARWPLMMFLHGSGERGSDVAKVKVHGPPKIADRDPNFPFILVSPLLPTDQDWDLAKLDRILDEVIRKLPVDPQRIYLTGLSRGGHATWRWAAAEPSRFAAIAAVAGRGDPASACALKDLPAWALHGDRDDVVPPEGSFAMARAIRACGGQASRLTIYPDLGHNAWDPAYDDPALYLWFLSHRNAKAGR